MKLNLNHVCITVVNYRIKFVLTFGTGIVLLAGIVGSLTIPSQLGMLGSLLMSFISAGLFFLGFALLGAMWFVAVGIYERLGEQNNLTRQMIVNGQVALQEAAYARAEREDDNDQKD